LSQIDNPSATFINLVHFSFSLSISLHSFFSATQAKHGPLVLLICVILRPQFAGLTCITINYQPSLILPQKCYSHCAKDIQKEKENQKNLKPYGNIKHIDNNLENLHLRMAMHQWQAQSASVLQHRCGEHGRRYCTCEKDTAMIS
jgi:hypothetical protein